MYLYIYIFTFNDFCHQTIKILTIHQLNLIHLINRFVYFIIFLFSFLEILLIQNYSFPSLSNHPAHLEQLFNKF
jgi:hypothetical protein